MTLKRMIDDLGRRLDGELGGDPPPPATRESERVPYWRHPHADTRENATQDPSPIPPQKPGIEILLNHYRDVLEGIPDHEHRTSDDLLALMCPAWNSPAYQQLERLLRVLHERFPRHRQALRVRYERYAERKVAYCRKCGVHPAKAIGSVHSHPPGRSIALSPKMLRVPPSDDNPKRVEEAIEWLSRHWRGQIVIPKAIAAIEAERSLRQAA